VIGFQVVFRIKMPINLLSGLTNKNVTRHSSCRSATTTNYGLRFDPQSSDAMNVVNDFVERFHTPRSKTETTSNSIFIIYCLSYHEAVSAIQHSTGCLVFSKLLRNNPNAVLYMYRSQPYIQRPLSCEVTGLAYKKVISQSTQLSSLKTYQRTRILGSAMAAILSTKFASGNLGTRNVINCSVAQHILRRTLGSYSSAVRISKPYVQKCNFQLPRINAQLKMVKQEMKRRYDDHAPTGECLNESIAGPTEFHVSEFYVSKCIHLLEGADAEQKWAYLDEKIQMIRRGELEVNDVLLDPANDYWMYSVFHTYYMAVKRNVDAVMKWRNFPDINDMQKKEKSYQIASSKWQPAYSWDSGIRISKDAPRRIQTIQLLRILYAFLLRTHRILSDRYIEAFGFNEWFKRTVIMRFHELSTASGDEASALMMAHFVPSIMTPQVHLDIMVSDLNFQTDCIYIRMSDPVFGHLKTRFRNIIPSRHNGKIKRVLDKKSNDKPKK